MYKFSACLIFFLLLFSLNAKPILAATQPIFPEFSDGEIQGAVTKVPIRFLPSSPMYFSIWVKENFTRFLKPSAVKRADFDIVLSQKRLEEAYKLLEAGDIKNASSALLRYQSRTDTMLNQISKARSQNQDVETITSHILDGLQQEELLLYGISKKVNGVGDSYNVQENYVRAVTSFILTVDSMNKVKPGIINRYKSATTSAQKANPTPTPESFPTSSSSAVPVKIIY